MNGWPVLLTAIEAAQALRTDVAHVWRLHAEGRLPGVRLFEDEPVRFRPEDVLDVVDRLATRESAVGVSAA